MTSELFVSGIPESADRVEAAVLRSRLLHWAGEYRERTNAGDFLVAVGTRTLEEGEPAVEHPAASAKARPGRERQADELSIEERAEQYASEAPLYPFEFLIVPEETREELLSAVDLARVEHLVFDTWNLRSIEPFPRTALNFYGKPGTGKTLAAHSIASYLGRRIIVASYAQIESKYHGEGPKNIEALFHAAERDDAVLFIDEADSLLSKRLTNVTQGSEQAINSMRSQLLVSLGQFEGLVIFATNLIVNYDEAFHTRMRNIRFPLPDERGRAEIWRTHLPAELPLADDVSVAKLAKIDDVVGRDIKTAVIDAAVHVARLGGDRMAMHHLTAAILRVKAARPLHGDGPGKEDSAVTPEEEVAITEKVRLHLAGGTPEIEPPIPVESALNGRQN